MYVRVIHRVQGEHGVRCTHRMFAAGARCTDTCQRHTCVTGFPFARSFAHFVRHRVHDAEHAAHTSSQRRHVHARDRFDIYSVARACVVHVHVHCAFQRRGTRFAFGARGVQRGHCTCGALTSHVQFGMCRRFDIRGAFPSYTTIIDTIRCRLNTTYVDLGGTHFCAAPSPRGGRALPNARALLGGRALLNHCRANARAYHTSTSVCVRWRTHART